MSHELNTGGDRGYLRIATEEAFATREQIDAFLRMVADGTADKGMTSLWGFYAKSPSKRATEIIERLLDLGERRIADMDATGIDVAILSLTSPGVQPLFDVGEAKAMVTRCAIPPPRHGCHGRRSRFRTGPAPAHPARSSCRQWTSGQRTR